MSAQEEEHFLILPWFSPLESSQHPFSNSLLPSFLPFFLFKKNSEDPENWAKIENILSQPLSSLASLDEILNQFSTTGSHSSFFVVYFSFSFPFPLFFFPLFFFLFSFSHPSLPGQKSKFFSTIPGSEEAKNFDFNTFWEGKRGKGEKNE